MNEGLQPQAKLARSVPRTLQAQMDDCFDWATAEVRQRQVPVQNLPVLTCFILKEKYVISDLKVRSICGVLMYNSVNLCKVKMQIPP